MIPITTRAMSRYLAYRNAPRLAAYLAPPVDDVVTRLRPAPRAAAQTSVATAAVGASDTPAITRKDGGVAGTLRRQPGTRACDAVAAESRPALPPVGRDFGPGAAVTPTSRERTDGAGIPVSVPPFSLRRPATALEEAARPAATTGTAR